MTRHSSKNHGFSAARPAKQLQAKQVRSKPKSDSNRLHAARLSGAVRALSLFGQNRRQPYTARPEPPIAKRTRLASSRTGGCPALVGECRPGQVLFVHLASGRGPADRPGGAVAARASSGLWRGALALGGSRVGLPERGSGGRHPQPDGRRLRLPDPIGGVDVAGGLWGPVSELHAVYL